MGLGTHVIQIINRQQAKRNQQKAARRYYRIKLDEYNAANNTTKKEFNFEKFPQITGEEKQQIRIEVQQKLKSEYLLSIAKTILTLFVLVFVLWLVLVK